MEEKLGNLEVDDSGVGDEPEVLTPKFVDIPNELVGREYWVAWQHKIHENKDGTKRWTKIPIDVSGGFASSTDPETWTDFETVVEHYKSYETADRGIGFVVSSDDEFLGVDFDDCRDPETGEIDDAVEQFVLACDSYIEVSPSGTGLRMFLKSDAELGGCEFDLPGEAHAEVYNSGRYLTVTGHRLKDGSTDVERDSEFVEILDNLITS
jgi:primase-polymerase (primpol)-like protein